MINYTVPIRSVAYMHDLWQKTRIKRTDLISVVGDGSFCCRWWIFLTWRLKPCTENCTPLGGKYGAQKAPPRATEWWKAYSTPSPEFTLPIKNWQYGVQYRNFRGKFPREGKNPLRWHFPDNCNVTVLDRDANWVGMFILKSERYGMAGIIRVSSRAD